MGLNKAYVGLAAEAIRSHDPAPKACCPPWSCCVRDCRVKLEDRYGMRDVYDLEKLNRCDELLKPPPGFWLPAFVFAMAVGVMGYSLYMVRLQFYSYLMM
jgi:hypothetical protein